MQRVPRFKKATDNTRPHGSHRYDVFAPKLNRTLTLFGRLALDAWILLEADPDVECYCERPVIIPDTKPKRVIDFWVQRRKTDEFLFLLRPSELANSVAGEVNNLSSMPAFQAWANTNHIAIKFTDSSDGSQQKILLANWGWIIRDIAAFGRLLPKNLIDDILKNVLAPTTFDYLERHFLDIDPVLVRIAIFSLLHRGRAACPSLGTTLLNSTTVIEPT